MRNNKSYVFALLIYLSLMFLVLFETFKYMRQMETINVRFKKLDEIINGNPEVSE